MEENKRYSYDAGYKLKVRVLAYAEEHGNRAAERHFGPPPTEKAIRDWRASKEYLKKIMIFRDFKGQFGFINYDFFLVWLCNLIIKMVKMFFFLKLLKN